jgi:hypothetical protein
MADPVQTILATPDGLLTVAEQAAAGRGEASRAGAHRTFLAAHWLGLAAAAFAGYEEYGPGAVMLWRDQKAPRLRPRPFEPERLFFATQVHTLPGVGPLEFEGWEASLIETYDPQRDAVVIVVEGAAIRGYRLSGDVHPPEALRRSRIGLN